MPRTKTELNILPSFNGDSILIKSFDSSNKEIIILIDGGTPSTFEHFLKNQLKDILKIDLIVLTHIDNDHIGGLINFFKNSLINKIKIKEIWYNQPDVEIYEPKSDKALISVAQGDNYKSLIKLKLPNTKIREITTDDGIIEIEGLKFSILSPTIEIKDKLYETWLKEIKVLNIKKGNALIRTNKPIYSKTLKVLNEIEFKPEKSIVTDIYNSSSISFLLNCPDISILLLADSRAEIISEELKKLGYNAKNPLPVDFVKISHHGSLNNTSQELLSLINSNQFIISTNGGTSNHMHPSRETIARIVYKKNRNDSKLNIYTNYDVASLKSRIGEFISIDDFKVGNWKVEHKNTFTKNDL